jgi:hypothetical protein
MIRITAIQAIADRLNADGYTTRRGEAWSYIRVARALKRTGKASAAK